MEEGGPTRSERVEGLCVSCVVTTFSRVAHIESDWADEYQFLCLLLFPFLPSTCSTVTYSHSLTHSLTSLDCERISFLSPSPVPHTCLGKKVTQRPTPHGLSAVSIFRSYPHILLLFPGIFNGSQPTNSASSLTFSPFVRPGYSAASPLSRPDSTSTYRPITA